MGPLNVPNAAVACGRHRPVGSWRGAFSCERRTPLEATPYGLGSRLTRQWREAGLWEGGGEGNSVNASSCYCALLKYCFQNPSKVD